MNRTSNARQAADGRHLRPMSACALLLAAGLLAACGGGGGGDSRDPQTQSIKLQVSAPGALTQHVQTLLRQRATARLSNGSALAVTSVSGRAATDTMPNLATISTSSTVAFSASLTQEHGVDEPDLIKTDGNHLFSLDLNDAAQPQLRVTQRLDSGVLQARGSSPLQVTPQTQLHPKGLLASTDASALAVASEGWAQGSGNPCVDACPAFSIWPFWSRSFVAVERFDVRDPATPRATRRLEFDGQLIDARRVGDRMVVVSQYHPLLAADQLPAGTAAADRDRAVTATQGRDALPRLHLPDGSTRPLMDEAQCWVQPANASLELVITSITVLDLKAADLAPVSRCFVGGTEAMLLTPQSLVLASTRWSYASGADLVYPPQVRTDLHRFTMGDLGLTYSASGEVPGHLGWDPQRKSFRLSEHEGTLRVLSFTGDVGWGVQASSTTAPSPATLTVLRESEGELTPIATLPNANRPQALGKPGEQVHGVRFVGTRAYVVTFRRTDPLYLLDLSDPADPKLTGELEVPGFSDHLLPLPNGLLLGVGHDADSFGRATGVQFSLFDVADAARPRLLASHTLGHTGSISGLDTSRQGLSMLQVGNTLRLSTPTALYDTGFTQARDRLQPLEVDLQARTLTLKPAWAPSGTGQPGALWQQRSLLIGDQVVWLREGRLSSHTW